MAVGSTSTESRALAVALAAHQAGQLLGRAELSRWPFFVAYAAVVPLFVWRRPLALWALVALSAAQCLATFPRTANHAFLAVFALALLALREEAGWLTLAAIAFSWGGAQKLVHGLWFDGQVLGWLIAHRTDVSAQLRPFISDETAAHLTAGRYVLPGVWLAISNAVWVTELAAPAVLLSRRHAWWLLLAGTWAVQAVAHEWEFALLLSLLALGGAPPRARAIGCGCVIGGVAVLALARLGVLPVPYAFLPTVSL